ncbi:MAG: hypothetical protein H6751_15760 [Candidatus Omnitrophica bacterium]|nr:hypothetical protein [Candidatus Omnitrophota bacterium]MCB9784419.1 hypothetical protein [Candidatus Omnitrophota bacterium]
MSGIIRNLFKVRNCSWCQKDFLWGRFQAPARILKRSNGDGYCCARCSRALARQMTECHEISKTGI